MQKSRLSKGGALVVVLISALVLVILGVGFIFFSKIFGGGREMQNAVDSGSLNAAKTALIRPGTNAQSGDKDETQFLGFENPGQNPDFSLGNINRVWGQALLVSLNFKAMEAEGTSTTEANTNANLTVAAAKRINDRVAAALRPVNALPPSDLQSAFLNTSNSNTLKMVSSNSNDQLQISNGAQVGFQDAKGQSNIAAPDAMMANIVDAEDLTALQTTLTKISAGSTAFSGQAISRTDGSRFNANGRLLNGYQDIEIDEQKKIYFVPLRPEAKPHMLSGTEFNATKPSQLTATDNPVNNSFFTKGKMKEEKSAQMLDFAAIALAEPVDPAFSLSIPRGFVKVKNWKGFSTTSTMLDHFTNNDRLKYNNGANRGMHAAEYANHQLLMARSSYRGPNHASQDPFATEMGNPYFGLAAKPSGQPLTNADGAPIYGRESQVQELININDAKAAGQDPPDGLVAPSDEDKQCGGRFATPLPDTIKCSDIRHGKDGFSIEPAEVSVSVNGDGEVVATNPGQQSALSTAIVAHIIEQVHDTEDAFGSDIHPHIWSIDPQKVTPQQQQVANFMRTSDNPNDPYAWLYTGQLIMDDNLGKNHMSRGGVQTQSPIAFGRAGTIWEYLEDKEPGVGTSNLQDKVLNRIAQRVLEIKPDFGGGNVRGELETLLKSATLDMNQDAYIFMDNADHTMKIGVVQGDSTNHVSGAQLPDWLKAEIQALGESIDGDGLKDGKHPEQLGKTVFYGPRRSITTQPDPLSEKVENVPGDWGYPVPYTNADNPPPGAQMVEIQLSNKFVFRPCTGYQGQLAVLELKSFIHNPGCPPVDYSASPPTFPEECPCTNFPVNSIPEPQPNDPNMPNGWTRGPGVPTDTVLPNCSHTGAC
ncbi:MAG: hypothetical protein K2X77_01280 [Candidatus Obscuribacterales bacterium]|jgi:hypothetical protein|nr:hypothetical protein [Candidatus Obscuribacterales bacterium]